MQFGFFTMPIHPPGRDWRQCLREDREAFLRADQLGLTAGHCGGHAPGAAENITSCSIFLASLAGAAQRIRLGTCTVNMPNTHPAAVAAETATLDHLLDGRCIFAISPGGLPSDAEASGNLDEDRTARSGCAALLKRNPQDPDDSVTLDGVLDDLVTWGTPGQVVDDPPRFREQAGRFGTLRYAGKDWVDPALARRSMVLLAEKVRPALQTREKAA